MLQLAYHSTAADTLGSGDVFKIVQISASNNGAADLTGFLLFSNGQFFQVIEGPEEAINALMQKLKLDDRHHSIKIAYRRRISERSFPNWRMKRLDASGSVLSLTDVSTELANATQEVKSAVEDWFGLTPS